MNMPVKPAPFSVQNTGLLEKSQKPIPKDDTVTLGGNTQNAVNGVLTMSAGTVTNHAPAPYVPDPRVDLSFLDPQILEKLQLLENQRETITGTIDATVAQLEQQLQQQMSQMISERYERIKKLLPHHDVNEDVNEKIWTSSRDRGIRVQGKGKGGVSAIGTLPSEAVSGGGTRICTIEGDNGDIRQILINRGARSDFIFLFGYTDLPLITDFDNVPTRLPLFETWKQFQLALEEIDAVIAKIETERGVIAPEAQPK